ncbi:MAG: 16S rRNA (adenine(1518)-N(6)/adenine(1519)-N(6))-dimethyltransferase RsmA [Clostridiaceae bacterium]|nr:16S rRNA (adenine(1518)-N(6)/adenine(1519)-N(6))-dimethyltransferase RsmA [Clostridiaceae bacterium]
MKGTSIKSSTLDLMRKYDFKTAKKFGQNFLTDETILKTIIDCSELSKNDCVLEIGPGMGIMTQILCEKAGRVLAVEIDRKLISILRVSLFGYENVEIINDDILKLDLKKVLEEKFGDTPVKIVANLPYYITTPIIMKLLEEDINLKSITVMVQKEVGERICASPGGKDYGALTVAVQYRCIPRQILIVPPESFIPQPEVESMVVRLDSRDKPPVILKDEKLYFRVVKASFGQRRKTLLNALSAGNMGKTKEELKEILLRNGIDEKRRGETLSLEEFAKIANDLNS